MFQTRMISVTTSTKLRDIEDVMRIRFLVPVATRDGRMTADDDIFGDVNMAARRSRGLLRREPEHRARAMQSGWD